MNLSMKHTDPELITPELLEELHRISPYNTNEKLMIAKMVCRVLGLTIEKEHDYENKKSIWKEHCCEKGKEE